MYVESSVYMYLSCVYVCIHVGRYLGPSGGPLEASYAILGTILGRLGPSWASSRTNKENHGAAVADLETTCRKNVDFLLIFKAKIRKTLKKRYVLKATNAITATRINKMSQKKEQQQRAGFG